MSTKSNKSQPDEEQLRVKQYKMEKHQYKDAELIDEDELDEEVYDFVKRHLKK